jgi:hypothetical protein
MIAVVLGAVGSLIAWEITLHYRTWCKAIIRSATKQLPEEQRPIREEEWLAALNDCVGLISAFAHAGGCWIGAAAVARHSPKVPVAQTKTDKITTRKTNLNLFGVRVEVETTIKQASRRLLRLFELFALLGASVVVWDIVSRHGAQQYIEIIRNWLSQHF